MKRNLRSLKVKISWETCDSEVKIPLLGLPDLKDAGAVHKISEDASLYNDDFP